MSDLQRHELGAGSESVQDAIYIAVMGITGAGKSSFISQCCPDAENIIGLDLDSFTQKCVLYTLKCKGKTVFLIDTPGFNDTKRKDIDVLREVATWLASSIKEGLRLNGIVFLHGIHQARFAGSDFTNLKMFKELTGMEEMGHVVLTTSYWDVTPETTGVFRERLLLENDDFWKLMKDAGATIKRFKNDRATALSVVESIVVANEKTTLKIQSEMHVGHKNLNQTSAGRELDKELNEHIQQAEEKFEKETAILTKALKEENTQAIEAAMREQDRLKQEMVKYQEKRKMLDVGTEALLREKDNEIKQMREETERLKLEHQRTGDDFKRALEEKDKEAEQRVKENDTAWEVGLLRRLAELHREEAASVNLQRDQEEHNRRERQELEQMMRRLMREHATSEASKPPPYTSTPSSPFQQQQQYSQQFQQPQQYYPGQYYPSANYQQQAPYDPNAAAAMTVAGLAAGGASLAGLAAISTCTCM